MAKIIPLNSSVKASQLPLSPLMIKTLKVACEMQRNRKPFGQAELDGSFMALLKRQLIDCKTSTRNGKERILWFVTKAGIVALKKSGNA
jgi:hypothetical protein